MKRNHLISDDSAPVEKTGADRILYKVCGVTLPAQAGQLKRLGVDLLGLNFHPQSPRFVDFDKAVELVRSWGDPKSVVGVFVNRPADEVLDICRKIGIGIAQLHGDETPETVASVARIMPVIRAFRVQDVSSLEAASRHLSEIQQCGGSVLAALIDGYAPGAHGGTGVMVGEALVKSASGLHPRLILAGGLNTDNLNSRLDWIRPWAVDVASGVEDEPGVKNLNAVEAMIRVMKERSSMNDG